MLELLETTAYYGSFETSTESHQFLFIFFFSFTNPIPKEKRNRMQWSVNLITPYFTDKKQQQHSKYIKCLQWENGLCLKKLELWIWYQQSNKSSDRVNFDVASRLLTCDVTANRVLRQWRLYTFLSPYSDFQCAQPCLFLMQLQT